MTDVAKRTAPILPPLLDGSQDTALLERAVRSARSRLRRKGQKHPRREGVMCAFALGSTYASMLCLRFGLDPDEMVAR